MAYDTKALLSVLADTVIKSKTLKEVYLSIMKAANVEGVTILPYEEAIKEVEKARGDG
ncbi:MAG: hypothetical protein FWG70_01030 [Oscillospiraceae bacterium]|nr:hypothetical protein [Oscillospiraceae bacterium]